MLKRLYGTISMYSMIFYNYTIGLMNYIIIKDLLIYDNFPLLYTVYIYNKSSFGVRVKNYFFVKGVLILSNTKYTMFIIKELFKRLVTNPNLFQL